MNQLFYFFVLYSVSLVNIAKISEFPKSITHVQIATSHRTLQIRLFFVFWEIGPLFTTLSSYKLQICYNIDNITIDKMAGVHFFTLFEFSSNMQIYSERNCTYHVARKSDDNSFRLFLFLSERLMSSFSPICPEKLRVVIVSGTEQEPKYI